MQSCGVHGTEHINARGRCVPCNNEYAKQYARQYRKVNREKILARKRAYRARAPEERTAAQAARIEYNRARAPEKRMAERLKKKYGISLADYTEMFVAQGCVCAICKQPPRLRIPNKTGHRGLNVDHCHDTKKVRGLLCTQCNTALGLLKEDRERLYSMINYLQN